MRSKIVPLVFLLASAGCFAEVPALSGTPLPPAYASVVRARTADKACSAVMVGPHSALTAGHCLRQGSLRVDGVPAEGALYPDADLGVACLARAHSGPYAALALPDAPEVGQVVVAAGYGLECGGGARQGDVTATVETDQSLWPYSAAAEIPVCGGDSGGGVFDLDGRLVGVLWGMGVGSNEAQAIYTDLRLLPDGGLRDMLDACEASF